jgi:hypothetical protein
MLRAEMGAKKISKSCINSSYIQHMHFVEVSAQEYYQGAKVTC